MSRVASQFFPGAISFVPLEEDGAHQCDRILVHWKNKRIVLVDAKAKPARSLYPDTGINEGSFKIYEGMGSRHRALVLLAFIDESCGLCYGNFLHILAKPRSIYWRGANLSYPLTVKGKSGAVICFPIEYMRSLAELESCEIEELQQLSTRGDFPPSEAVHSRLGIALVAGGWAPKQSSLLREVA